MCEHSSFPWRTTYPTVFLTERLLMLYTESRSRWEMDASTLRVRVETVDRAPGLLTQVNDQLRYSASKVQFENRNSTTFRITSAVTCVDCSAQEAHNALRTLARDTSLTDQWSPRRKRSASSSLRRASLSYEPVTRLNRLATRGASSASASALTR